MVKYLFNIFYFCFIFFKFIYILIYRVKFTFISSFDLSKNPSDYSIINYIIESVSEGCDFNLISQNSINQNIKQEITLNFINNEDT